MRRISVATRSSALTVGLVSNALAGATEPNRLRIALQAGSRSASMAASSSPEREIKTGSSAAAIPATAVGKRSAANAVNRAASGSVVVFFPVRLATFGPVFEFSTASIP